MAAPTKRKPAAILAASVVGDSPLVGSGPAANAASLETLRLQRVERPIAEYGGQVVRRMGDDVLAEFASVVEAVECAIAIQKGIVEADVGEAVRIRYRVGVNVGSINAEADDILGPDVDDAGRLATLAEPGGICLARAVYDEVKSRLKLEYEHHSDWMHIALMSTNTPDSWPSTMDLIEVSAVKIGAATLAARSTDAEPTDLLRSLRRFLERHLR